MILISPLPEEKVIDLPTYTYWPKFVNRLDSDLKNLFQPNKSNENRGKIRTFTWDEETQLTKRASYIGDGNKTLQDLNKRITEHLNLMSPKH